MNSTLNLHLNILATKIIKNHLKFIIISCINFCDLYCLLFPNLDFKYFYFFLFLLNQDLAILNFLDYLRLFYIQDPLFFIIMRLFHFELL